MAIDDYMESEVGVAVAATAAALSPRARSILRQGAVYGLAGALKAGDFVYGTGCGVVRRATGGAGADGAAAPRSSSTRPTASRSRSTSRSGTRRTSARRSNA